MTIIDESTKVGLFKAIGAGLIILGGVFWLSAQHVKANYVEQQVNDLKVRQEKQVLLLQDIRESVIRIEAKLQLKGGIK